MGENLSRKILRSHLVEGEMVAGKEIGIRIDQTLTQDATGTMAFLQFEAIGVERVRTELSVNYVDHNTLQAGFENADDHRFLADMSSKYGVKFSRPGNGICHQVHLERFGAPGKTLLGSDSHTPTGGGLGMLAIGAGGLDVAMAMAGAPFYLVMPGVVNVRLHGALPPWVSAKDVILEVLRRISVKGGLRKILEYSGEGVACLTAPERGTIANMGAETGATSSIFPSDEVTRAFLRAQGRESDWVPLAADPGAGYDEEIDIDLSALTPLVACPHSPDNVCSVGDIENMTVDQVMIGSCTNSSLMDMLKVAAVLKGRTVHPGVSLVIAPGSRQVITMLARCGALEDMVAAGARILETACGPCVGMGQAPPSGGVSLRTVNRNFKGRSGTADAQVFLVSPETAAASAVAGVLTDPRTLGAVPAITLPEVFLINDNLIVEPACNPASPVRRGPNIKPLAKRGPMEGSIKGQVLIKVGDNISTDHIMPAGAKVLPLRSNIPALAEHVFEQVDPGFTGRAKKAGGGWVVGGENYGQGSSREHAALVPMYLGVKAVLAKSIARIHRDNLVNFGILPLTFEQPADYDTLDQGDDLEITGIVSALKNNETRVIVRNVTKGLAYPALLGLTPRQVKIVLAGGLLNMLA